MLLRACFTLSLSSFYLWGVFLAINVQCVPLATEPGISLIILTPMKILQEYARCVKNEKECVCSVCLYSASNFVAISSLVVKLLKNCRVR